MVQRDGTTISSGSRLQFDVCIVGAGPCGLMLAENLGAKGWNVGIIESGGDEPTSAGQRLARGVRRGLPYPRLEHSRARAIGGTSWKWFEETGDELLDGGLRCRPLDPVDYEPRMHVPGSGWPIGSEEVEPWFAKAAEIAGIDAMGFPGSGTGVLGPESRVETCVSLFASTDVFRQRVPGLAGRDNVTVLRNATVLRIEREGADGPVNALRVVSTEGWFSITARAFVLAGGGIENARMLLASPIGRPGAQANRFDQVGRYFMEHIHVDSGFFRPSDPRELESLTAPYRRHLDVRGTKQALSLRLSDSVQQEEGTLNSIVEFFPRRQLFTARGVRSFAELAWGLGAKSAPERVAGHLVNVARQPRQVAVASWTKARGRHLERADVAALIITAEQAPNPNSRVTLANRRDRFGTPMARLEWHLTKLDYDSIRRTQAVIGRELEKAELGTVEQLWGDLEPTPRIHGCWHHIGTTRMSNEATAGVVDSDCRVHGTSNLFVAGSSVMPTAGAATVTLTAVALAMRLADHLDRKALPGE